MTIAVFLSSLLGAMALGMPIAFALLVCGLALMWHLDMFDTQILAQNLINGADNFPLLAVPFFILAGELMNAGGLSRRIIDIAMALVWSATSAAGWATSRYSPPSSSPASRARRSPTPPRSRRSSSR